jgi:hypothetical protein
MAGFIDHLTEEIQALERSLETDTRFVKLRELQRVRALYEASSGAASPDSPSLKDVEERNPRKKPPPREMTSATRAVVTAATEYLAGRSEVVPLRTVYHHISNERGIQIGGKNPINSLSAILSRYGFEARGRAGWKLRQVSGIDDKAEPEAASQQREKSGLFCAPRSNGSAEIHEAATPQ